jgi:hypothetical protein
MSLVDLLLVPCAKSPFSTKATVKPRDAASKAIPAPVMPPPKTRMSKVLDLSCSIIPSLLAAENSIENTFEAKITDFEGHLFRAGYTLLLSFFEPNIR